MHCLDKITFIDKMTMLCKLIWMDDFHVNCIFMQLLFQFNVMFFFCDYNFM